MEEVNEVNACGRRFFFYEKAQLDGDYIMVDSG